MEPACAAFSRIRPPPQSRFSHRTKASNTHFLSLENLCFHKDSSRTNTLDSSCDSSVTRYSLLVFRLVPSGGGVLLVDFCNRCPTREHDLSNRLNSTKKAGRNLFSFSLWTGCHHTFPRGRNLNSTNGDRHELRLSISGASFHFRGVQRVRYEVRLSTSAAFSPQQTHSYPEPTNSQESAKGSVKSADTSLLRNS